MKNDKCKICRRLGVKLFLKGDRCFSPKCAIVKRSYPPGEKGKRRRRPLSEYGKELQEKQKLKNWYFLRERQFRKYIDEVMQKRGQVKDAGDLLIQKLETRLDNTVFRMGFVSSRKLAKQAVGHGHFLINGRKTDIPSYQVKKGDIVSLSPFSKKKSLFNNLENILKKHNSPSWLKVDAKKLEGKVVEMPTLKEVSPPAEISSIFEFYSR